MKLTFAAGTDMGMQREINEDSIKVANDVGLFAVADGMGGHQAGEVASKLAVDSVEQFLRSLGSKVRFSPDIVRHTIRVANERIYRRADREKRLQGMGTTIVLTLFGEESVIIAHVGDSRAYRIRRGAIEQMTTDHSWIEEQVKRKLVTREEASRSQYQNILTRALGTSESVDVDIQTLKFEDGDVFVLCTDGLTGLASSEEILKIVQSKRNDYQEACDELISLVNERGAPDNISMVIIQTGESVAEPVAVPEPVVEASDDEPLELKEEVEEVQEEPEVTPVPGPAYVPAAPEPVAEPPVTQEDVHTESEQVPAQEQAPVPVEPEPEQPPEPAAPAEEEIPQAVPVEEPPEPEPAEVPKPEELSPKPEPVETPKPETPRPKPEPVKKTGPVPNIKTPPVTRPVTVQKKASKTPLVAVGVVVVLAALAGAAFVLLKPKPAGPGQPPVLPPPTAKVAQPAPVEPVKAPTAVPKPSVADDTVAQAKKAFDGGQYEAVVISLEIYLGENPNDAEAQKLLKKAQAALEKEAQPTPATVADPSQGAGDSVREIQSLLNAKDLARAEASAVKAAQKYPNEAGIQDLLNQARAEIKARTSFVESAKASLTQGDLEKAAQWAKSASERDPGDRTVKGLIAEIEAAKQQKNKQENDLLSKTASLRTTARAAEGQGDKAGALKAWSDLLASAPNDAEATEKKAFLQRALADEEKQKQAQQQSQEKAKVLIDEAGNLVKTGKLDAAEAKLGEAAALTGKDDPAAASVRAQIQSARQQEIAAKTAKAAWVPNAILLLEGAKTQIDKVTGTDDAAMAKASEIKGALDQVMLILSDDNLGKMSSRDTANALYEDIKFVTTVLPPRKKSELTNSLALARTKVDHALGILRSEQ